jgi:hypothetical protein
LILINLNELLGDQNTLKAFGVLKDTNWRVQIHQELEATTIDPAFSSIEAVFQSYGPAAVKPYQKINQRPSPTHNPGQITQPKHNTKRHFPPAGLQPLANPNAQIDDSADHRLRRNGPHAVAEVP